MPDYNENNSRLTQIRQNLCYSNDGPTKIPSPLVGEGWGEAALPSLVTLTSFLSRQGRGSKQAHCDLESFLCSFMALHAAGWVPPVVVGGRSPGPSAASLPAPWLPSRRNRRQKPSKVAAPKEATLVVWNQAYHGIPRVFWRTQCHKSGRHKPTERIQALPLGSESAEIKVEPVKIGAEEGVVFNINSSPLFFLTAGDLAADSNQTLNAEAQAAVTALRAALRRAGRSKTVEQPSDERGSCADRDVAPVGPDVALAAREDMAPQGVGSDGPIAREIPALFCRGPAHAYPSRGPGCDSFCLRRCGSGARLLVVGLFPGTIPVHRFSRRKARNVSGSIVFGFRPWRAGGDPRIGRRGDHHPDRHMVCPRNQHYFQGD